MENQRSPREEEARNSLPDDLRPVFDYFVADYRFHGTKRHGKPYISYIVLADMVRAGWRLAAEPTRDDSPTNEKANG